MKSATKLTTIILILALACWAQTSVPTATTGGDQKTPAAQSDTNAQPACCKKMAEGKDAMSCCSHSKDAKSDAAMSCCSGKAAKSCMKGNKSAKAACADGKYCNGDAKCCNDKDKDGKAGCAECAKTDTMATACCGHGHCGMSHDQAHQGQ